jgi:hypothetical protein
MIFLIWGAAWAYHLFLQTKNQDEESHISLFKGIVAFIIAFALTLIYITFIVRN